MKNKWTEEEFIFLEEYDEDLGKFVYEARRVYIRAGNKVFVETVAFDPEKHVAGDVLEWWEYRHKVVSINRAELEGQGRTTCRKTGDVFVVKLPPAGILRGPHPLGDR
ncbi:MAG: hypothetical protein AB7E47_07470 [Desulfovibrionaceae bacterium]